MPRVNLPPSFVSRHDLWTAEQARAAARGRARDQAAQARSGALFLRRSARRAARQDLAGVGSGKRHAQRRHHDDDAAGQGHLAQKRVSGVHRRRRLRHGGNAGRRRLRHGRRSDDLPRAALGGQDRLAVVRHRISATASRCRSRPARAAATRWQRSPKPASTFSPGWKSNSICSSWRTRGSTPADATWPPASARGEPAHPRLSVSHRDRVTTCSIRRSTILRRGIEALGLPLRSVEVELGPEPGRIHLPPAGGPGRAPTPWCCSARR